MRGWLGQSEAVPQWFDVWGFAALSRQPPLGYCTTVSHRPLI